MSNHLGQWWESYLERVLPRDAGPVQIIETKRAFYAGAESMMRAILAGLDPGTEPTDNDLRKMDEIEAELRQFGRDVAEGRA